MLKVWSWRCNPIYSECVYLERRMILCCDLLFSDRKPTKTLAEIDLEDPLIIQDRYLFPYSKVMLTNITCKQAKSQILFQYRRLVDIFPYWFALYELRYGRKHFPSLKNCLVDCFYPVSSFFVSSLEILFCFFLGWPLFFCSVFPFFIFGFRSFQKQAVRQPRLELAN